MWAIAKTAKGVTVGRRSECLASRGWQQTLAAKLWRQVNEESVPRSLGISQAVEICHQSPSRLVSGPCHRPIRGKSYELLSPAVKLWASSLPCECWSLLFAGSARNTELWCFFRTFNCTGNFLRSVSLPCRGTDLSERSWELCRPGRVQSSSSIFWCCSNLSAGSLFLVICALFPLSTSR